MAPRTVRFVTGLLARTFAGAVLDERIASNPFVGVKRPFAEDKDPLARAGWEFSWDEIAQLVYGPELRLVRRVWHALAFGTGARPGELVALRWSDWDRGMTPLTRLSIVRARKAGSGTIGLTKTGARKPCPVHPAVEAILTVWWERGWAELNGRAPTRDDPIITTRLGSSPTGWTWRDAFAADLRKLKLRHRHQYATRHTFISRILDDGGARDVVRWITHAPPRSAFDGYAREPWNALCVEVSKLRFPYTLTASSGAEHGSAVASGRVLRVDDCAVRVEDLSLVVRSLTNAPNLEVAELAARALATLIALRRAIVREHRASSEGTGAATCQPHRGGSS